MKTIAVLVLKALIRQLDLQTHFYNGLWATTDTAIAIAKKKAKDFYGCKPSGLTTELYCYAPS